jgi:hypothetical protein
MKIRALGPGGDAAVAGQDTSSTTRSTFAATARFLTDAGHHLSVAYGDDERPVGFVSGVELTHPDKGTEMFLYELGLDEAPPGAAASAARSSKRSPRSPANAAATACSPSPTTTTRPRARHTARPADGSHRAT